VTVIKVTNTSPFQAAVETSFTTGAEPWNIVISPNGRRVFVANSAQDTISVIDSEITWIFATARAMSTIPGGTSSRAAWP
jgi:YVTN family beta-propeller protein